jgi:hypothetical protein
VTVPGHSASRRGASAWTFWPHFVLRSAGFPAVGVLKLADSELAHLADDAAAPGNGETDTSEAFRAVFEARTVASGAALWDVAARSEFQRAVLHQNPGFYDNAVRGLLARPRNDARRDSRRRKREDGVASYWQRYCVKNESIGFFGPIAWGILDDAARTRLTLGERLVSRCELFFETWAIERLAAVIERLPSMAEHLRPRRQPFVRLEPGGVRLPQRPPVPLTAQSRAVLAKCDGRLRAREIARTVVAEGVGAGDVYAILSELRERRLIAWQLDVPVGPRPEESIRRFLAGVEDDELRAQALALVDELGAAKDAVAEATADPPRLRAALDTLDETFTRLTSATPTRHAGRTYAGRTLVYSDCRRDVTLELGREVAGALEPLRLLLTSARWLSHTAGQWARVVCDETDARLRAESSTVDLATLWFACLPIMQRDGPGVVAEARAELQRRWSEILKPDLARRRLAYSAADLRDRVAAWFDAPSSGWSLGRYYSPDVLVAADDVEAIARGDFEVVLGELHPSLNSVLYHCFVAQHPRPDLLWQRVEADFPSPRLAPVLPKESPPRLTGRTHPILGRPSDFHVELFQCSIDTETTGRRLAADLVVKRRGGRLVVSPERGSSFDVVDVFSQVLTGFLLEGVGLFGAQARHTPRVVFDRCVIARETWRLDAGELSFARERDLARRFLGARLWWRSQSLPRHVFVTSPLELKPFYVDFDSPVYVGLFTTALRRVLAEGLAGAMIEIVEMLPTFDQLWLVDRAGNRFVSELRLVAFDLLGQ